MNIWDVECIDSFYPEDRINDKEEEEEIIPVPLIQDDDSDGWEEEDDLSEIVADNFQTD